MRALMITAGTLIFAAGFVAGGRLEPPVGAQGFTVVMDCGASAAPRKWRRAHGLGAGTHRVAIATAP